MLHITARHAGTAISVVLITVAVTVAWLLT